MGSNVGNAGRWRSRARLGAVSAVTALVAGLVVAMTARVWTRPSDADTKKRVLSAAPADAWLVLSADVAAAWPLLEPIVGTDAGVAGASRIAGLGTVSAACGFEPLEHVRQLLVALPEHPPEGGDHGDFGLAFDGDFTSESLEACARKAILAGGATPDVTTRADYTRIAGGPRGASLAVRPGGPYLVGRGAWLDAMIDAVDGKGTPTEASGAHEALRRDLLDKAATEPGLVITALLPKALRDRLAGESEEGAGASAVADAGVGAGAGAGDAGSARNPRPPNPADRAGAAGVLGVREAGLAIVAHGPGAPPSDVTDFDLEIRCDTARACADVETFLAHERFVMSGDVRARLMGLGPFLDAMTVNGHWPGARAVDAGAGAPADPQALSVRTHGPTRDLAAMLARLAGLGAENAHFP